jgi:tetratricopeptide (TPR) repeat protein
MVVIALGTVAAIRMQKMSHELDVERRAVRTAQTEPAKPQQSREVANETIAALASNLQQAAARAEVSAEETKLRNDALLAASAGVMDSTGSKQLASLISRLRAGANSLDTLNAMGNLLASRDQPAQAAMCFSAVLDAPNCSRPQRVLALTGLADSAAKQSNLQDADELYRELIDLERADREFAPRALQHLAESIKIKIRRDLEEDANEAVSAMFSRLAGNRAKALEPAYVRQTLLNLTDFAVDQAHPAVAIRLLDRALLLKDASSSAVVAAPFRQMLLTLHTQNGSELEARRLMKKLLTQQQKEMGNDPEVANTAMQVAALDEQLGDLNGAEKALKLALNIRERAYGNDHPDVADTAYALARVYERQGRRSESEALLGLVKGIWARKRTSESTEDVGEVPQK